MTNVVGETNEANVSAVQGNHGGAGDGVQGLSNDFNHSGVAGRNDIGVGVLGISNGNDGVRGFSEHQDRSGVVGTNSVGVGVLGQSDGNDGVRGFSKHQDRSGVVGTNTGGGVGVLGQSEQGTGVVGTSSQEPGVHGRGPTGGLFEGGSNAGVHAVNLGNGLAGRFEGDVEVTGDIRLLNGDCAEDFDVANADSVEPGTVMVLGKEGMLHQSQQAYDKRVAGVVSGAGGYKPGLILDKQQLQSNRLPVALLGKVYCKVDATDVAIEVGDLLTTSDTSGCAMKAADPLQAFGAVIGKALRPLREGQGLIPILIALQ